MRLSTDIKRIIFGSSSHDDAKILFPSPNWRGAKWRGRYANLLCFLLYKKYTINPIPNQIENQIQLEAAIPVNK